MVVQKVLQRRWEPWRWGVQWPTIRSWQWPIKSLLKLILLQLHEKLLKNSTLTILQSFSIWLELERWKSSISGCLMSWPKIKNIVILKCQLFFFCATTQTISPSDCDIEHKMDFIWQLVTTSSVAGPRRSSKTLPKAKLGQKRSWSLFGGMLPIWFIPAFWILAKPLYLRSMLSR